MERNLDPADFPFPPLVDFLRRRPERTWRELAIVLAARPETQGTRRLELAYRWAVSGAVRAIEQDRRAGFTDPEGRLDGKGVWRPSKREQAGDRPALLGLFRRARCRSRAHCEKLVAAWLGGGAVPPEVGFRCRQILDQVGAALGQLAGVGRDHDREEVSR